MYKYNCVSEFVHSFYTLGGLKFFHCYHLIVKVGMAISWVGSGHKQIVFN